MTALLDVNVLIALLESAHIHHDPAQDWFASAGRSRWASCLITENGFLRIVTQARYPYRLESQAAI